MHNIPPQRPIVVGDYVVSIMEPRYWGPVTKVLPKHMSTEWEPLIGVSYPIKFFRWRMPWRGFILLTESECRILSVLEVLAKESE